jgi:hypothetical protein
MKIIIAAALLTFSFLSFAGNLKLKRIINKYESKLMDMRPGMTSASLIAKRGTELNDNGEIISVDSIQNIKTVILKVDGTKIYQYERIKHYGSKDESVVVNLIDYKLKNIKFGKTSNVKEVNNSVAGQFFGKEIDNKSILEYKGTFSKNLLSPIFCNLTISSQKKNIDRMSGKTYSLNIEEINQCDDELELSDIKKIDLSAIEFCDTVSPQDPENICAIKNMSFLTHDL